MEEAVLGEEVVDDSSSSEEEPGSQVEFVGEVKHCEARIGDEAFEESFFSPLVFICQNTIFDIENRLHCFIFKLFYLRTYP